MSVAVPGAFNAAKLAEIRAWTRYFNIARLAAFVSLLVAPFSLWALFWTSPRDYPFLSSMVYIPLITYACVLLFNRVWRNDRFLKLLLTAGMGMRIAAAGAYVWLGFFVFNVAADAFHYWTAGLALDNGFASLGWSVFRPPWTSSNLICNLCGLLTIMIGNAMPTLFVLFALIALWGAYFFYRAFCIAFPNGNRGLYGVLLVLLPSIVYWSSAIGKDALEQFFIGLSAYGFAKTVKQISAGSIAVCVIGIAGAAFVRPHIGAMLATSMLVPFTVGKAKGGWFTVAIKILLVPILAAGTYFMISQAQTFVGVEGSDFQSSVSRLKVQSRNIDPGGSTFNEGESLSRRIIQGPFLVFRPFPWEAHNGMAAVAALEGTALLFLAWRKRRDVWALMRHWREAFVLFILIFTLEFSVIFSAATSNFGILVRERIMLVPIFLMIFCAKLPANQVAAAVPFQPRRRSPSEQPILQLNRSLR